MNTGAQFIEQLVTEFPELRDDIKEDEGLLHVQMGAFARTTQAAIDAGDFQTLRRQFMLADRFFRDAAPDLENAFYVSSAPRLQFRGCGLSIPFVAGGTALPGAVADLRRSAQ